MRRAAIRDAYAHDISDEFIVPAVIDGYRGMRDGDGVLCFNFRADRVREILAALLDPAFSDFPRTRTVQFAAAAGMTQYSVELDRFLGTIFPPQSMRNVLGAGRVRGWSHAAAHGRDGEVPARHLFPQRRPRGALSRRGPHHGAVAQGGDLRPEPEMSAPELTDKAVEAIG